MLAGRLSAPPRAGPPGSTSTGAKRRRKQAAAAAAGGRSVAAVCAVVVAGVTVLYSAVLYCAALGTGTPAATLPDMLEVAPMRGPAGGNGSTWHLDSNALLQALGFASGGSANGRRKMIQLVMPGGTAPASPDAAAAAAGSSRAEQCRRSGTAAALGPVAVALRSTLRPQPPHSEPCGGRGATLGATANGTAALAAVEAWRRCAEARGPGTDAGVDGTMVQGLEYVAAVGLFGAGGGTAAIELAAGTARFVEAAAPAVLLAVAAANDTDTASPDATSRRAVAALIKALEALRGPVSMRGQGGSPQSRFVRASALQVGALLVPPAQCQPLLEAAYRYLRKATELQAADGAYCAFNVSEPRSAGQCHFQPRAQSQAVLAAARWAAVAAAASAASRSAAGVTRQQQPLHAAMQSLTKATARLRSYAGAEGSADPEAQDALQRAARVLSQVPLA